MVEYRELEKLVNKFNTMIDDTIENECINSYQRNEWENKKKALDEFLEYVLCNELAR